jgi:hypothetical protein
VLRSTGVAGLLLALVLAACGGSSGDANDAEQSGRDTATTGQQFSPPSAAPRFLTPGYVPAGFRKTSEDTKTDRSGVVVETVASYQPDGRPAVAGQPYPVGPAVFWVQQRFQAGGDVPPELKTGTPTAVGAAPAYMVTNNAGNKHAITWAAGDVIVTVGGTDVALEEIVRMAESMR